jgi:threonine synthase
MCIRDSTVPTGNFGDVFAGWCAKAMGLPIEKLVIATNANDILRRTLDTGRYDMGGVTATISPSMDIEVSSNFERLLFEATGRDAGAVVRMMEGLKQSRGFAVPEKALAVIREGFAAGTTSEAETARTIGEALSTSDYLLDPHTAVGVKVAREHLSATPMITLATAHPAKFPAAVHAASGVEPPLPDWLADLHQREERVSVLANDAGAVEDFILARTRA